jgi:hypothetical protein
VILFSTTGLSRSCYFVVSPAAKPAEQPADVIEPDDSDGELA